MRGNRWWSRGLTFTVIPLCLLLFLSTLAWAQEDPPLPRRSYDVPGEIFWEHHSPTLEAVAKRTTFEGRAIFYLEIWVEDPVRQFWKATSEWNEKLLLPVEMIRKLEQEQDLEVILGVNGSGFLSEVFKERIPQGANPEDYYHTDETAVTVTHGELFRTERPMFTGMCLEASGLHIYEEISSLYIEQEAIDTWGFREDCCLILDGKPNRFEGAECSNGHLSTARTCFIKVDHHNYVIVYVSKRYSRTGWGIKFPLLTEFAMQFEPESAFNLDGGGSSRILLRTEDGDFGEKCEESRRIWDMICLIE